MQIFISLFTSFPLTAQDELNKTNLDLASIIFPNKNSNELSVNDMSDIRHVATVIENNLEGLVTNDERILSSAVMLNKKYGIDVVSSSAFVSGVQNDSSVYFESQSGDDLELVVINSEKEVLVREFLLSMCFISSGEIDIDWLQPDSSAQITYKIGIFKEEIIIGYITWPRMKKATNVIIKAAVNQSHSHALDATRIMLNYMFDEIRKYGPCQVSLHVPVNQSMVKEMADSYGFASLDNSEKLTKIVLGKLVCYHNWSKIRSQLIQMYNLRLPETMPEYSSVHQSIKILAPDGNQRYLSLESFERFLSPFLMCLRDRPAVLVPIRKDYSESLFGHSNQMSLLPLMGASMYSTKHYISDSKTFNKLKRGTLVLFYESKNNRGRGAVIAIARIDHSYIKHKKALDSTDYLQSVLTGKAIDKIGASDMKTVTVFDNLFLFEKPVLQSDLIKYDCGSPNDLITANLISAKQLSEILTQGFNFNE